MKRTPILAAAIAALGLTALASLPHETANAADTGTRTPVLVELFTSEGCSSCPPADGLLKDLLRRQPVPGAEIIAIGEHVDYWNSGGWADPYSARAYTVRQNNYAASFHNSEVYTPQMVVDGKTEFVGSDAERAQAAIGRAARAPKAQVTIMAGGASPSAVTVTVHHMPPVTPRDAAQVWLAVTQDGLSSHVTGGENRGRTLAHVAVARSLRLLGTMQAGQDFTGTATVKPTQGGSVRAVAFVQEQGSRRVLGAAVASLP